MSSVVFGYMNNNNINKNINECREKREINFIWVLSICFAFNKREMNFIVSRSRTMYVRPFIHVFTTWLWDCFDTQTRYEFISSMFKF